MRPSEFVEIVQKHIPSLSSQSKMSVILRALSKEKLVPGREDLTPLAAGWILYTAAAAPSSNYHALLLWLSDRKHDFRYAPNYREIPAYALAVLLVRPDILKGAEYVGASSAGLLFVHGKNPMRVFPPSKISVDGQFIKVESHLVSAPQEMTLIPAQLIRNIAAEVDFLSRDKEDVIGASNKRQFFTAETAKA